MFSVIFEVNRKPDKQQDYLDLAVAMKPILRRIDGFIDNERFESQIEPGWLLSHSTWRDEKSLIRWRIEGEHNQTQRKGRFDIFQDYHLRVGEIIGDTTPPADQSFTGTRFDASKAGPAAYATLTEIRPRDGDTFDDHAGALAGRLGLHASEDGLVDHEIYKSISAIYPKSDDYTPGKMALLAGWTTEAAAQAWRPTSFEGVGELRHRVGRVIRDYAMFDRREAPQFYRDVEGRATRHAETAR